MEIKDVKNLRYDMNGNIFFDSSIGPMQIEEKNALEIAYALLDSNGLEYKILDELDEKISKKN